MHGFLILLVPVLFVGSPDDAAAKDQTLIQGKWRFVRVEVGDGPPAPPEEILKKTRLTFTGDKLKTQMGGDEELDEETFSLNPQAMPKAINMTTTSTVESVGPDGTKERTKSKATMLGIYKIEGDRLTFCFMVPRMPNPTSRERPKEFFAEGHNNRLLIVLEREKEGK
jgi:uncharacterized protein (TIGR03067 family)